MSHIDICYRLIHYEPSLGRFLTSDPHPGKLSNPITHINKYIYTGNNPVNFVDPDGLSPSFPMG